MKHLITSFLLLTSISSFAEVACKLTGVTKCMCEAGYQIRCEKKNFYIKNDVKVKIPNGKIMSIQEVDATNDEANFDITLISGTTLYVDPYAEKVAGIYKN